MAYFNNLTVGGTAKFLQDVKWPGLKSTVGELNYLHKEEYYNGEGWILPQYGDGCYEDYIYYYNTESIGLIAGNSYLLTYVSGDSDNLGAIVTESIIAVENATDIGPVITLPSETMDEILVWDGCHYTEDGLVSGGCCWVSSAVFNCVSIKIEGQGKNGTLKNYKTKYNKIPNEHLSINTPPVILEEEGAYTIVKGQGISLDDGSYSFIPRNLGIVPGEVYTLSYTNEDGEAQEMPLYCKTMQVEKLEGNSMDINVIPLVEYNGTIFPLVMDQIVPVTIDNNPSEIYGYEPGEGSIFATSLLALGADFTLTGPGLKTQANLLSSLHTNITGFASFLQGLQMTGFELQELLENQVGRESPEGWGEVFNSYSGSNIAYGDCSHAEGSGNKAYGDYSHVEGVSNKIGESSSDDYNVQASHAEGESNTIRNALGAHAEGGGNTIEESYGHAEGRGNHVSGYGAHVEGQGNTVYGRTAHAEGFDNTAKGDHSHVEGSKNGAIGHFSHASGNGTIAFGECSSSGGQGNKTYQSIYSVYGAANATTYTTSSSHINKCQVGNILEYIGTYAIITSVDKTNYKFTVSNTLSSTALSGATVNWCDGVAYGDYSSVEGWFSNATNLASKAIGKQNRNMNTGGAINTQVGDVFVIGNGVSGSKSNAFRVDYTGGVYGLKAFNSSGADYAEFIYPWFDDNKDNEDRIGYFTTFKDGKLYKATSKDIILGITSGNPSIVGNADEDYYWRYERDEFNRIIFEDVEEEIQKIDKEGNPIFDDNNQPVMEKTGNIIKNGRMKLNENYDPTLQGSYIERKDRAEWDYVGMLGILPTRDDGTCIPGQYCKCNDDGIATLATAEDVATNRFTFIVLERVSDNVVKIVLK